jgi:uncharacterized Zn finger protein
LIRVLLYEGEVDEAWKVASDRGCSESLWLDLALARERTHPQEAIKVYAGAARTQIAKANRGGYQTAMKHLRRIEKISERTECEPDLREVVAGIRNEHVRKTSLMAMLDAAGW